MVIKAIRKIDEIEKTGPADQYEKERLDRAHKIPEPVRAICLARMDELNKQVVKLEHEHDWISDYLQGFITEEYQNAKPW